MLNLNSVNDRISTLKPIGGIFLGLAAMAGVSLAVNAHFTAETPEATRQISERQQVCDAVYVEANGFWRTMVDFTASAVAARSVTEQKMTIALEGFHPALQTRYGRLADAIAKSKLSFTAQEQSAFVTYFEPVKAAKRYAWLAVSKPSSLWSPQLKAYFNKLHRSGRQTEDANYTKELDLICLPQGGVKSVAK